VAGPVVARHHRRQHLSVGSYGTLAVASGDTVGVTTNIQTGSPAQIGSATTL